MVNPMLTAQQQAQAKEVGKFIQVKFIKRRLKGEFTMQIIAESPEVNVAQTVDTMVNNFATQLYTVFGIGGEIEEVE